MREQPILVGDAALGGAHLGVVPRPIYKFINRKSESSAVAASQRLTDHPEYRADLIDA